MCPRWDDFRLFLEDMEDSYTDGMTIERVDVNGDYCPSNCEWATHEEQAGNKRQTRWVTWEGEKIQLFKLARRFGVKVKTVKERLQRGWELKDALTRDPQSYHRKETSDGTRSQVAACCG